MENKVFLLTSEFKETFGTLKLRTYSQLNYIGPVCVKPSGETTILATKDGEYTIPGYPYSGDKEDIKVFIKEHAKDLYVTKSRTKDNVYVLRLNTEEPLLRDNSTSIPRLNIPLFRETPESIAEQIFNRRIVCPKCGAQITLQNYSSVKVKSGEKYVANVRHLSVRTKEIIYAQPYVFVSICKECSHKRDKLIKICYILFGPVLFALVFGFFIIISKNDSIVPAFIISFVVSFFACGIVNKVSEFSDIDIEHADKCGAIYKFKI